MNLYSCVQRGHHQLTLMLLCDSISRLKAIFLQGYVSAFKCNEWMGRNTPLPLMT